MEANRNHLRTFLPSPAAAGENLGLRLDKLNRQIDLGSDHDQKDKMLEVMENFKMGAVVSLDQSYGHAFKRWKKIFTGLSDCECFEIEAVSKVLLGTGNASVYQFGVNLNRPWGVPYISGSTLKGLASSFLAKHYGEEWKKAPGPKSLYQVELFGGPIKTEDTAEDYIGLVRFMDAWLVPDGSKNESWFAPDIINTHFQGYYGENRRNGQNHAAPPDGTENPVPNKIAALKSGLKFMVSIMGGEAERGFVKKILEEALANEGIGAKTAVGYGRFEIKKSREEKDHLLIKEIESADMETLLNLYKVQKNVRRLHDAFREAADLLPLSAELKGLYLKLCPMKLVLMRIREGKVDKLKKLADKNEKRNLKLFFKANENVDFSQTPDGKEIYQFAKEKLNVDESVMKNNNPLKWLIPK